MEDVYDLYRDNYKHDWEKWENTKINIRVCYAIFMQQNSMMMSVSWNRRVWRCQFFPNDKSRRNLNQNPRSIFVEIKKLILKSLYKVKGPRIAKTILRKNKVGGLNYQISLWNQESKQCGLGSRKQTQTRIIALKTCYILWGFNKWFRSTRKPQGINKYWLIPHTKPIC